MTSHSAMLGSEKVLIALERMANNFAAASANKLSAASEQLNLLCSVEDGCSTEQADMQLQSQQLPVELTLRYMPLPRNSLQSMPGP